MSKIYVTSDWHFNHDREFIWKDRGFSSVDEMNEILIENFNKTVNNNDLVYCLGDCMMGQLENAQNFIPQLNGHIIIVAGNHDTANRINYYKTCPNVEDVCWARRLNYNGYHFYMSHYATLCSNYDDKGLKYHTLCLCGHMHTKDKFSDMDKGIIYHTEVDAHENAPVSLDKIIEDLKEFYYGKV